MSEPPARVDGCKNCQRLDRLFQVDQRQRSGYGLVDALQNHNRAFLFEQLRKRELLQREERALESHGWENDLTDGLSDYADCVPGALDI